MGAILDGLGNVIIPAAQVGRRKVAGGLPLAAVVGDSVPAQGFGGSAALGYTFAQLGFMTWAVGLSRQRVRLLPGSNFAVAGETTAQMLARIGAVVAFRPALCVVSAGTNDTALTYAQTVANLAAIYDTLAAAGIRIIAIPILPRGGNTTAQDQKNSYVNQWIESQRLERDDFFVVNCSLVYGDPATGAPRLSPNYSDDALHPTALGAYAIGNEIAKLLAELYPETTSVFSDVNDVYSAVDNPSGNLIANGLLAGTAGSLSNGPTGSLADSWSCNGVNMPSGSTVAFAKVAKSDGRSFQQLTFGGTYNNSNPGNLNVNGPAGHANAAAGDTVEAMCEVEVDAGAQNLAGVQLFVDAAGSGWTATPTDFAFNNTAAYGTPGAAHTLILRTPRFTLPGASTTLRPVLRFSAKTVAGSSPLAGVVRFGSVSLRKVKAGF